MTADETEGIMRYPYGHLGRSSVSDSGAMRRHEIDRYFNKSTPDDVAFVFRQHMLRIGSLQGGCGVARRSAGTAPSK